MQVDNFSSEMVDRATENGKAVESYHIIVAYPRDVFKTLDYEEGYKYFLPEYLIERRKAYNNQIQYSYVCYYGILHAFYLLKDFVFGMIKSDCGCYEPNNLTVKHDWGGYSSLSNVNNSQERMEMGIYNEKGMDIDLVIEEIRQNLPDIIKDDIKIIDYKKVKSNPRKQKVECTDPVYDQFGVLIEKGDLIAYPKGGDHNYYYVCKDEVIENTPKFVRLKGGDMTKAEKVIVIKSTNPNKKLSF